LQAALLSVAAESATVLSSLSALHPSASSTLPTLLKAVLFLFMGSSTPTLPVASNPSPVADASLPSADWLPSATPSNVTPSDAVSLPSSAEVTALPCPSSLPFSVPIATPPSPPTPFFIELSSSTSSCFATTSPVSLVVGTASPFSFTSSAISLPT